ncbi:hypothetical protein ACG1BZ_09330 [Microbulbifer sp. CNSA002]|uniref:hypothetical protein n=1 Tax=Microbulbifer sp. CNSA002 TaxID=3373604 RepID=UPI0039B69361
MHIELLNEYGNELAKRMVGDEIKEYDFKGILDYVLYQRDNAKSYKKGFITSEELATLILQHLYTALAIIYKLSLEELDVKTADIHKKIHESIK